MKIFLWLCIIVLILLCLTQTNTVEALALKQIKKMIKELLKFWKKGSKKNKEKDDLKHILSYYNPYNKKKEKHEPISVYEMPKVWGGHLKIPNFMGGGEGYGEERLVQGVDNRFGIRIALPFLGDFQYVREAGPGYYTKKLGPGEFNYPGLRSKPPIFGNQGHESGYHHQTHDTPQAESHASEHYTHPEEEEVLNGLRNYPWVR